MHQVFRNLNRIGSGAFAQIIAHDPHVQCIGLRFIAADTANKYLIFFMGPERHRVLLLCRFVLHHHAGLPLALQLLFYPGTAGRQDSGSHRRYARGLVLEQEHIDYFFGQYIDLRDRDDWRFAPLNAPDVEGTAPAWIGLAECDPLFDEGIAYADKLRAAGVPVELEVWRGVTHEFIKMGRALPEAREAHAAAARALANTTSRSP